MKKIIALFSLILLTSCSGEWHLRKAIKKGAQLEVVRNDTLIVDTTLAIYLPPDTAVKRYVINCDSGRLELSPIGSVKGKRSNVTATIKGDTLIVEGNCDEVNEELHLYKELYSQCTTRKVMYNCDCLVPKSWLKWIILFFAFCCLLGVYVYFR
jgi:hypothetical protein